MTKKEQINDLNNDLNKAVENIKDIITYDLLHGGHMEDRPKGHIEGSLTEESGINSMRYGADKLSQYLCSKKARELSEELARELYSKYFNIDDLFILTSTRRWYGPTEDRCAYIYIHDALNYIKDSNVLDEI